MGRKDTQFDCVTIHSLSAREGLDERDFPCAIRQCFEAFYRGLTVRFGGDGGGQFFALAKVGIPAAAFGDFLADVAL